LRALLARYYFGDEGFYKALNSGDQAISRSLEVFKDAYKSADY
jgi:carboxyl-terminal processing protease